MLVRRSGQSSMHAKVDGPLKILCHLEALCRPRCKCSLLSWLSSNMVGRHHHVLHGPYHSKSAMLSSLQASHAQHACAVH